MIKMELQKENTKLHRQIEGIRVVGYHTISTQILNCLPLQDQDQTRTTSISISVFVSACLFSLLSFSISG